MFAALDEFVALLRRSGVAVPTDALIDAGRAVALVGLDDRAAVYAALRATLVARRADHATFDDLFTLYFRRGEGLVGGDELAARLASAGLPAELVERLLALLAAEATALSPMARAALGLRTLDLAALIRDAGLAADLAVMTSPLQVGFQSYRIADALGVADVERELAALAARLAAAGGLRPGQRDAVGGVLADGVAGIGSAIRRYVEAEFRRQNLRYGERSAVRAMSDRPLASLSERDVVELRHEVQRLAQVLRARLLLAPIHRQKGRLDVGRTLRHSLATLGVPFELHRRLRQRRKPRLVVLCDISDSVRNVSRFMLEFAYALQELFDHVYSFAFVAEIGELTSLFRDSEIGRAIEQAYAGEVVNVFANSNYGSALAGFTERHLGKVNRRTTVLIIGDGRTNYHPPRAALLADIRKRARQIIWLNPEPPAAWGFGDSAMREYAPHCDRVAVANNLDSLRRVIDDLVA